MLKLTPLFWWSSSEPEFPFFPESVPPSSLVTFRFCRLGLPPFPPPRLPRRVLVGGVVLFSRGLSCCGLVSLDSVRWGLFFPVSVHRSVLGF